MPDRYIESHIRRLPKFANIPDEHIGYIVEAFRTMRTETGEVIFQQGDATQGLYLFISGSAHLIQTDEQGGEHVIGTVTTNQYLNEEAAYKPGIETASLRAAERSTLLFLSRMNLLSAMTYHPEITQYLPVPVVAEFEKSQRKERAFKGQRANETVLLDTRRHWWSWARRTWLPIVIMIIILTLSGGFLPTLIAASLDGLAIIIGGGWIIYMYLEWRNDHVIITNQRIVRIEREIRSFKININEVPLVAIQAVNADIITTDPFSRLFNYGTVDIRTAGDGGNIKLTLIPYPDDVQDLIFANRNSVNEIREQQHLNTIRATIDKVIKQEDTSAEAQAAVKKSTPEIRQQERGLWPTYFVNNKGSTVFRKHRLQLFKRMLIPILLLLAAVVILVLSFTALSGLGLVGTLIAFLLFIISTSWAMWVDWDWRRDMYIIGDDTIEILRQRPLWLQNESDHVLIDRVDNVSLNKSGLLPTLMDYGDVTINLLGGDAGDRKVFRGIPQPEKARDEISRRLERQRTRKREAEERARREEIAEYLTVYHQTVGETNPNGANPDGANPDTAYAPASAPANPAQQPAPPANNAQPLYGPARPPGQYGGSRPGPTQRGTSNPPPSGPPSGVPGAPPPPPRRPSRGMRPPNIPRTRRKD